LGRGDSCPFGAPCGDCAGVCGPAYVGTNARHFQRDDCADGRCGGSSVVSLSDERMVGVCAAVWAGALFVRLLGVVFVATDMATDGRAGSDGDVRRQRHRRVQHAAVSANECFHHGVLGSDGLYDGFDDTDDGDRRSLNMPQKGEQTLMERILPHVRSMMQPLVMVMPVLYAGMLLGGIAPLTGLLVLLLLIASAFGANIVAGVIALVMIQKQVK